MTDRIDERGFAELSAAHALGALTPDESQTFEHALAADPHLRILADDDLDTAALLAETVPDITPPAGVRERLLARIGAEPVVDADGVTDAVGPASAASGGSAASAAPRPRRWSRTVFALAASLVVVALIGWGALSLWGTPEPGPATALSEIQAAPDARSAVGEVAGGGDAEVHWSESVGKVVLVADGLPSLDDDRTFELWFVRGDTPIPAGTFAVDGDTATAELEGRMEPGDTIAVTVESAGGSPTGLPTTDPILAVTTS